MIEEAFLFWNAFFVRLISHEFHSALIWLQ